jgi:hypothetical protein
LIDDFKTKKPKRNVENLCDFLLLLCPNPSLTKYLPDKLRERERAMRKCHKEKKRKPSTNFVEKKKSKTPLYANPQEMKATK